MTWSPKGLPSHTACLPPGLNIDYCFDRIMRIFGYPKSDTTSAFCLNEITKPLKQSAWRLKANWTDSEKPGVGMKLWNRCYAGHILVILIFMIRIHY